MDENNQSRVSGRYEQAARDYLVSGLSTGEPFVAALQRNVRTTRDIAERVHHWTGADIGLTNFSGHGAPPELVVVEHEDDLAERFSEVLACLLDDIDASEIGVVLADGVEISVLNEVPERLRRRLVALDVETVGIPLPGKILWGSAASFKGLEKPVILALGFSPDALQEQKVNELYVALTRCNYGLWLFLDRRLKDELTSREQQ
jgi:hypothetical protein